MLFHQQSPPLHIPKEETKAVGICQRFERHTSGEGLERGGVTVECSGNIGGIDRKFTYADTLLVVRLKLTQTNSFCHGGCVGACGELPTNITHPCQCIGQQAPFFPVGRIFHHGLVKHDHIAEVTPLQYPDVAQRHRRAEFHPYIVACLLHAVGKINGRRIVVEHLFTAGGLQVSECTDYRRNR